VLARGAVAVQCAPDAAFTTECRFENVPAEGLSVQVRTRAVGGPEGLDSPALLVFGDAGDAQTVVVQPGADAAVPAAGVYAGTLTLGGLFPVPIDVRVYDLGGSTRFEFIDRHGLALAAPLVLDARAGESEFLVGPAPRFRLFDGLTPEGLGAEILSPQGLPILIDLDGGHLVVQTGIPARGFGVHSPPGGLTLRIDALRRGPLPDGFVVPELTPDVDGDENPNIGFLPSAVFQQARAIADAGNPLLFVRDDLRPFIGQPDEPAFAT
jgi:hypothetical protein